MSMRFPEKAIRQKTLLAKLKEMKKNKEYVPSYGIALLCVGLGERDEAFDWLDRSYEERNELTTWIKVEPRFDSIRSDPRFVKLQHRMGF